MAEPPFQRPTPPALDGVRANPQSLNSVAQTPETPGGESAEAERLKSPVGTKPRTRGRPFPLGPPRATFTDLPKAN